jgi:hypothetical protein
MYFKEYLLLNILINRVSFNNFLVLRHPVPSRRKTWTPSLNCMTRWGWKSSNAAKLTTLAPSLFCMNRWCCETANIGAILGSVWSGDAAKLPTLAPSLFCMIRWCCETANNGAIFVLYDQVMLANWKHWRHLCSVWSLIRWCWETANIGAISDLFLIRDAAKLPTLALSLISLWSAMLLSILNWRHFWSVWSGADAEQSKVTPITDNRHHWRHL